MQIIKCEQQLNDCVDNTSHSKVIFFQLFSTPICFFEILRTTGEY